MCMSDFFFPKPGAGAGLAPLHAGHRLRNSAANIYCNRFAFLRVLSTCSKATLAESFRDQTKLNLQLEQQNPLRMSRASRL